MEQDVFEYRYSALQNQEVARIRKKYLLPQEDKLDTLRRMDRRVKQAGKWQGLTVGILGCLIFGIGMCFFLQVLRGGMWPAVVFFLIGGAFMIAAYPLYENIEKKCKAKLVPQIIRLSDELTDYQ